MTIQPGARHWLALIGFASIAIGAPAAAGDDPKDQKASAARDRAILAQLEKPIPLHFHDTPLEDILQFIRSATQGPNDSGIPIVVDPQGMKAPATTLTTRVSVDTEEGVPLKESLYYLLGKNGLRYRVKDGLLTISIRPHRMSILDRRKQTRAFLARLEQPVDLHFDKAPLEEVLKFINKASTRPKDNVLPIYVDPVGLMEAEVKTNAPVSIESKKGESLKSSLGRLLKPVGLTYQVKDGLLTIISPVEVDEPAVPTPKPDRRQD
jgi:hypothetical protein